MEVYFRLIAAVSLVVVLVLFLSKIRKSTWVTIGIVTIFVNAIGNLLMVVFAAWCPEGAMVTAFIGLYFAAMAAFLGDYHQEY